MTPGSPQPLRFRFGTFEADVAAGELRRQGLRVKLNVQPFQVLVMLLRRPGEVLTREEIARELWPEGTFVDHEHGVNSAVNRIREALGDSAKNPRFLETLPRRGYRFVAPVERVGEAPGASAEPEPELILQTERKEPDTPARSLLASPEELPAASPRLVRGLFLGLQGMYLAFYVGALANLAEIEGLFAVLDHPGVSLAVLVVTAAPLIPVRLFLVTAALFQPPGLRARYRRLWPFLLPFDVLWALSPFLLLHHLNAGVALACFAALVYSPFAQRALLLMATAAE